MNRNLSVYLDAMRWLAALGVFAFHSKILLSRTLSGPFSEHGLECVAVFFVLSGFVIRYVSSEKEKNWKAYTNARMARMYSVVFLAIAVTIVADAIGLRADPVLYQHRSWFNPAITLKSLVSYLTFTGEIWTRHVIVGADEPYWSLGFEVPYYAVFGIALFVRGRWKAVLLAMWALVVGPKIVAFLPLWLIGVAAYEIVSRNTFETRQATFAGAALLAGSIALYLLTRYGLRPHPLEGIFQFFSFGDLVRSSAYFLTIGCAAGASIVGFDMLTRGRRVWNPKLANAFRWLAGGSFTLYLTHQPMIVAARALVPQAAASPTVSLALMAVVFAITLLLAELGERRKYFYRKAIETIVWRGLLKAA